MAELEHGGRALARIHAARNEKKFQCYLTGFLEGIAASGAIEILEREPLELQCREFAGNLGEPDAIDIIEDIDAKIFDFDTLECLNSVRVNDVDPNCDVSALNRFFGFCAGVACDGRITTAEAQRIVAAINDTPAVHEHPHVMAILHSCREALIDGEISREESEQICHSISQVVGDSYSDTGLSSLGGVPAFSEDIQNLTASHLDGACVVLTGTFSISPRSEIEKRIEYVGGICCRAVSRKTDIIVVAMEAARDWKFTHMGGKLKKALELRTSLGKPSLVSEASLLSALGLR